MGPRPFSRGDGLGRFAFSAILFTLQWGHGLSAVETPAVIASALGLKRLQWGHGLSAVETDSTAPDKHGRGKLQWGHGLSAVETVSDMFGCGRGRLASMGPRPFSRGDH